MNRIDEGRRRVEARLAEVQDSIEKELGFAPRAMGALLTLAAFSVGFVAARRLFGEGSSNREPLGASIQRSTGA